MPGIVVAAGVIGLRWHYFTDTVACAAVGIGTVCGLTLLLDLPTRLRQPSGTAEEDPSPMTPLSQFTRGPSVLVSRPPTGSSPKGRLRE